MNLLTKVWGIGVQTAKTLYERNIKTIDELRKFQYLLNDNQKVHIRVVLILKFNRLDSNISRNLSKEFQEMTLPKWLR